MPVTDQRLSNRQIATLKHLAICCADGRQVTLTRDQREAMTPLWRRGIIEMWFRCIPDEGSKGVPFFRPSQGGWNLIRAIEGVGRYEEIFSVTPPTLVAFFVERVNLCKGRWDPDGGTATAYIWLVWIKGKPPRAPYWIPPGCRDQLTRPDDVERFTKHPVMKREGVA